jgi:hypothetical protein
MLSCLSAMIDVLRVLEMITSRFEKEQYSDAAD